MRKKINIFKMTFCNKDGQSLIELILLFPLFILFCTFLLQIFYSINGSINQQKITRGYFFARLKNNSLYPLNDQDAQSIAIYESWKTFGMSFIGWKERFGQGDVPRQPCYLAKIPYAELDEDQCKEYSKQSTKYVRVSTVYGLCGTNYTNLIPLNGQGFLRGPVQDGGELATKSSCTITK